MVSQCRPPAHLSTTNHVVLASHRIPFTLDTLCTIQCSTLYVHMPYLLTEPLSFIEKTLPFIIAQCTLSTPVYPCIPRYALLYPGIPPLNRTSFLCVNLSHFSLLSLDTRIGIVGTQPTYFYCGYCGCIPVGIVGIVHTAPSKLLATSQLSPVCITNTFSSNLSLNTFVNSPLNAVGIVHTMPMCETCNAQNTQGLSALLESYLRYASKVVTDNVVCPQVYWTTGQISNGVQCAL